MVTKRSVLGLLVLLISCLTATATAAASPTPIALASCSGAHAALYVGDAAPIPPIPPRIPAALHIGSTAGHEPKGPITDARPAPWAAAPRTDGGGTANVADMTKTISAPPVRSSVIDWTENESVTATFQAEVSASFFRADNKGGNPDGTVGIRLAYHCCDEICNVSIPQSVKKSPQFELAT
jgi:hypothetical protein